MPYQTIADLAGNTIVFPSPAAFAASILPRAHFKNTGITISPKYVKSHDSVYRNVAQGFYVAGGGVVRTFLNSAPEIRDDLKILWKTEPHTPHAIAVHPRFSIEDRYRLLSALLLMNDDVNAAPILTALNMKGFSKATDNDWNDVRALKIDLLTSLIEP